MLNLLTLTNLFPSAALTRHGIFVEERLRQLLATGKVNAEVIVPTPWFPFRHQCFGHYGQLARVPAEEVRLNRTVRYPRYPVIPKIGMHVAPGLMARAMRKPVEAALERLAGPTVVDGHFLYPDGVAAARLARELDLPCVLTARGQDVTLFPRYASPRRQILEAIDYCERVITVSEDLRQGLLDLGVQPEQVITLRNGVDPQRFTPHDPDQARARLKLKAPNLIAVGHLIERKNHALMIEALARVPEASLTIIGDGPLKAQLLAQAAALGCADRLHIRGVIPQRELAEWYSAADLSLLTSLHEGMANVMLESLACGTPVVATPVEGAAEVITEPVAGRLLPSRDPGLLAAAIRECLERPIDRQLTRQHGLKLGWDSTVRGLLQVFGDAQRSPSLQPA